MYPVEKTENFFIGQGKRLSSQPNQGKIHPHICGLKRVEAVQGKRNEIEHYFTSDKKMPHAGYLKYIHCACDFIQEQLNQSPRELLGIDNWNTMLETSELRKPKERCLDLLREIHGSRAN
jgi:hypothetical protein